MNEELKQRLITKLNYGERFNLRNCSLCDYPLTFFSRGGALYFDPGCNCGRYGPCPPELRSWSDLDFYLDPNHGHIPRIEAFCKEAI